MGVDVVDLARFRRVLERTPGVRHRLFTDAEAGLPFESLAARFAAKEAVAKALGAPGGLAWHDAEITRLDGGAPRLEVRGTVAAAAAVRGIERWHVSLSHDGGSAVAFVVAEGPG